MPQNEVKIIITGDSSSAVAATQKLEQDSSSLISKIKQSWLGLSAAIISAYYTASKAWNYMELGAKAQQAQTAYEQVTNSMKINGDKLLADLQRVTAGTIDSSSLMQKAVKGLAQELSSDQLVRIGEIARMTAIKQGIDVKDAFDGIADAIANNMGRSLKTFGVLSKEGARLVEEAMTLGIKSINTFALVDAYAKMQQASFNLSLINTNEEMQQLKAATTEVGEAFGGILMRALMGAMAGFSKIDEWLMSIPADAERATNAILDMLSQIPGVEKLLEMAGIKGRSTYWQDYERELKDQTQHFWELATGTGQALVMPADKVLEGRYEKAIKGYKEIIEALKKQIEAAKLAKNPIDDLAEAMLNWDSKVENLNPNIDETVKAVNELWNAADILRDKISKPKLSEELKKALGVKVDEILWKGLGFLTDKQVEEEQNRMQAYYGKLAELATTFETGITEKTSSELQKRLDAEDKWAVGMWDILTEMQSKQLISQTEFETLFQKVIKASGAEKLKIQNEYNNAVRVQKSKSTCPG